MKIVVLSGSSPAFDLNKQFIDLAKGSHWEWVIQSVKLQAAVVTDNIRTVSFIDIGSELASCDVLISHCGAGTVFWALEQKLKYISIVDTSRPDDHQNDLGDYLERNNYCLVLRGRVPTLEEIATVSDHRYTAYRPPGLMNLEQRLSDYKVFQ